MKKEKIARNMKVGTNDGRTDGRMDGHGHVQVDENYALRFSTDNVVNAIGAIITS